MPNSKNSLSFILGAAAMLSILSSPVSAQEECRGGCLMCDGSAGNVTGYECEVCDPEPYDCTEFLLWYWTSRRHCLVLDDEDPIDLVVLAQMLCMWNQKCGGGCDELYALYSAIVDRPLTDYDKYFLSRACGCPYEPPPPPPPITIQPMPPTPGANPDGSLNKSSPFGPWSLPRNPFEPNWGAGGTIDLATGAYSPAEIDLSLPAPGFRWNIGRTYCAAQIKDGVHFDSNTAQGWNWAQISQPEIRLQEFANPALNLVYLIYRADGYVAFKRMDTSTTTYEATGGAAGVIVFEEDTGGADTYTYYDQKGVKTVFFGFDAAAGNAKGRLWKIIDPAGNTAYVGHATDKSIAAGAYNSAGNITSAFDSSGRQYRYIYTTSAPIGEVYRLEQVTAGNYVDSTWVEVAKVEYEYYEEFGAESYGAAGDLKLVRVTVPGSESAGEVVRRKYYRYWENSTWSSGTPGHQHAIQYEVDFEGCRKLDLDVDTGTQALDENFFTASETTLKPYAKAYFEYDADHRIALTWMDGECGCSSGPNGQRTFSYAANSSFVESAGYERDSGDLPVWKNRTQIGRPDSSYEVHYFDGWGQPLSTVITAGNPASSSAWVTQIVRDGDGFVSETRTPANCTGYTHSTGAIASSSSAGLITTYTRYSASAFKDGFIQHTKWKIGTGGTAYFDGTIDYTAPTAMSIGDTTLTRPFVFVAEGVHAGDHVRQLGDERDYHGLRLPQ